MSFSVCGYLGSQGMEGRKVMRTPMEIHLNILCTSTQEELIGNLPLFLPLSLNGSEICRHDACGF